MSTRCFAIRFSIYGEPHVYTAETPPTDPEVGVTVTYHQEGRALLESRPQPSGVAEVRVGGPSWAIRPHVNCARCLSSRSASHVGRDARFVEQGSEVELPGGLIEVAAVEGVALDPEDSDDVAPLPFRPVARVSIPVELAQDLILR